jgi:hypothetical protein
MTFEGDEQLEHRDQERELRQQREARLRRGPRGLSNNDWLEWARRDVTGLPVAEAAAAAQTVCFRLRWRRYPTAGEVRARVTENRAWREGATEAPGRAGGSDPAPGVG